MEESTYKLCWSSSEDTINSESINIDASFVLISREDSKLPSIAVSALNRLGVNSDNINSVSLKETNNGLNIERRLTPLFKSINCHDKRLFVINMLPMSAQKLPLMAASSKEAGFLCFESTIEVLKLLSKLGLHDSSIIAISYDFKEEKYSSSSIGVNPWGGISRGMAVSADLEVRQRVISAELRCSADENAFIKLIIASTKETTEDRIVITDKLLLQPVIRRYDLKVRF